LQKPDLITLNVASTLLPPFTGLKATSELNAFSSLFMQTAVAVPARYLSPN
jgi:hypothetical protein